MKRGCLLAVAALVVGLLAACGSGSTDERVLAKVRVGADLGESAAGVSPLGVPATETGVSGVTGAVLTVLRGGEPVLFDDDGNEDAGGSAQVVLDPSSGSVEMALMLGSYQFRVNAHDDIDNLLATGSLDHTVDTDVNLLVPLISEIGAAELVGPVVAQPEQLFDVYLRVTPPGRPDLRVPTSDFEATYTHEGVTAVGSSSEGIRFDTPCQAFELAVAISRPGTPDEVITAADLSIEYETICPVVPGGIGIDVEPPQLDLDSFPSVATVGFEIELSGEVQDDGSGVDSVSVFDGPILLGVAELDRSVTPHSWRFPWTPAEQRSHNLRFVAQDNAGNQSSATHPTEVTANAVFSSLSGGGSHVCGLTSVGAGYCWGNGQFGRLGNGETGSASAPTGVAGSWVFQQLESGLESTCGLSHDGDVACWGRNNYGQLGNGTYSNSAEPVAIDGPAPFTAVRVGSIHACARAATGTWYCWGSGDNGRLGDGGNSNRPAPVLVDHEHEYQDLAPGNGHTCGLTADGTAYCWGSGSNGQLGNGLSTNSPTPVAVSGGHVFSALVSGPSHTCGLTANGAAYCWGANTSGTLGDGTEENRAEPVAVTGSLTFQSLTAGVSHSCGVTASGSIHCWGYGLDGRLGDGNSNSSLVPVQVDHGAPFASVTATVNSTCGVTASGPAYCWGNGEHGKLGNGLSTNQPLPAPVLVNTTDM